MKKTVTLALTLALVLGLLSGCANNDTPADNAENSKAAETAENFTDEMKIPYAVDLSPEDGADSVERSGDHENSPYFAHPDVYNMESTDTLTVLTHFRTMQQTSEWSCGVTAALMVLERSATGTKSPSRRCATRSTARSLRAIPAPHSTRPLTFSTA